MNLKDIKFTQYLSVISILGFTTILIQTSTSVDISQWVNSMLFFLIGLSLFVSGGYKLIFSYFKGGLTVGEMNRIVTVVVGVASMFVGILTTPILDINYEVFTGIKIIISIIAIMVITFEMFDSATSCKR